VKIVRVVGIVLAILFWIAYIVVASPKSRKVKVYLDAPTEVGRNEEFTGYLMEQMRLADWDNESFEFQWVKATEAEYIITMVADKNKLPVMMKTGEHVYETCFQFILSLTLDKMVDIVLYNREGREMSVRWLDPTKTHHLFNQQMDCDPNEMARRAVEALMASMGLKPVLAVK
jgi:hypothetical protein